MRLAIRIVAIVLGVIAVLLIAAALFVRQFDAEDYAGFISELVKNATGRELVIEGPVRLEGFPQPADHRRAAAVCQRAVGVSAGDGHRQTARAAAQTIAAAHRPIPGETPGAGGTPEILLETNADGHASIGTSWRTAGHHRRPRRNNPLTTRLTSSLFESVGPQCRRSSSETARSEQDGRRFLSRKSALREAFAEDRLRVRYRGHPIRTDPSSSLAMLDVGLR